MLREEMEQILQIRAKPPGWLYNGMQDFILTHGKVYCYAPLPEGVRQAAPRQCFLNAYRLAKRRRWWYVEGLAHNGLFGTHHAWTVDPTNPEVAIDPTWAESLVEPSVREYMGIIFKLSFVQKGPALDDWQGGWKLFKGEVPTHQWKGGEAS